MMYFQGIWSHFGVFRGGPFIKGKGWPVLLTSVENTASIKGSMLIVQDTWPVLLTSVENTASIKGSMLIVQDTSSTNSIRMNYSLYFSVIIRPRIPRFLYRYRSRHQKIHFLLQVCKENKKFTFNNMIKLG
jgi:hypothetical protein